MIGHSRDTEYGYGLAGSCVPSSGTGFIVLPGAHIAKRPKDGQGEAPTERLHVIGREEEKLNGAKGAGALRLEKLRVRLLGSQSRANLPMQAMVRG